MKRILTYALVLVVVLVFSNTYAQQDFSNVQITTTHVAGNVYMLQGSGGNIGVSAGPDGILIVDDQFAPLTDKIIAALNKLNSGELQFILNTHYHGDHTGGNEILGKTAPIISHTNTRKRLLDQPKSAIPVITFDDAASIHFNGEEIKAVHYPTGHTDGDLIIFFTESNVVHMGDDFFVGRFPYVDIAGGGNAEGLLKNIETAIATFPADVKIIPGHGPLADVDDLKTYHAMLEETIGIIKERKADGMSLEEIRNRGLPAKYEDWGSGFIDQNRWIEIVFNSIK
ncbi:MBL fold metallo-hydrolase [candidate division KSB1 bacterium]|nr:MBL fold metallo-hydrolase [candidate division KSB1 bacterium]